ncbi:hypothetical protein ES705_34978 [subsurface metagenome]
MGYGAAGVDTFTGLLDTPASYAGEALKLYTVNALETGLESKVMSRFTLTQIFQGSGASPPTTFFVPYTLAPHWATDANHALKKYGSIIVNNNLYIFGGYRASSYSPCVNCHKFNLTTQRWEKLADLPIASSSTGVRIGDTSHNNGKIYWIAQTNAATYKLFEYDILLDTWAQYTVPGSPSDMACIACTDFCYIYLTGGVFYNYNYTTHAFTGLTGTGAQQLATWGKIGDEIYAAFSGGQTRLYDKALDTWSDLGQAHSLIGHNGGASNVEDENALWGMQANSQAFAVYRYTTAGGWVTIFTNTRAQREADSILVPAGYTTNLAFFTWGTLSDNWPTYGADQFAGGTIAKYSGSGAWELYSGAFVQGDLIIFHEAGGVPVHCEKDGVLLFVADGMSVFYVVDAGTYTFTLSKDYHFYGVDIYRSVWG